MESLNKIIKGLECCTTVNGCGGCPYKYEPEPGSCDYDCCTQVIKETIEVLKELRNEQNCQ